MALYAVIGRLVVEYARAETYVNLLARHLLGNDHAGLIVFSGMRLGDLTDRIRGMLRVNQATEQDCADIDACLVQLDLIGKVRQKLTHRYVGLQAPELIQTHNLYTAKTPEGEEIAEFTPGQLNEMISDCIRIRRRILRHTDGEVVDLIMRSSAQRCPYCQSLGSARKSSVSKSAKVVLGCRLIKSTIQEQRPDRQRPSNFAPVCRSGWRCA